MWLGFALLLGLLVFIIWDGRRLRRADPIPREVMRRGFTPSGSIPWLACSGTGAIAGVLALMEWQTPSTPPFTGRGRWLRELAYSAFGERGGFALLALMCVALVCFGLVLWQRSRRRGGDAG